MEPQPDADYIKMFVGQLPRSMDEADLTRLFEEFGRVHQINVLRDKVTGQSKGECMPPKQTVVRAWPRQRDKASLPSLAPSAGSGATRTGRHCCR